MNQTRSRQGQAHEFRICNYGLGTRNCGILATHTSKRTNILTTTFTPQTQYG